jgi:flagellar biosynthesis protein FlhG
MNDQAQSLKDLQNRINKKPGSNGNNIITFSSGKGGTGKTFISMNLAFLIAAKKKILLIDLDLNLGNSHLLLNFAPLKTIGHYFTQRDLFRNIITKYDNNLDFIFGDSGLDYDQVDFAALYSRIYEISSEYDFVFIDLGAGINKNVLNTVSFASLNCIITTSDTTAVMDAYVLIKTLLKNNYSGKNIIIVNRCLDNDSGINSFNNLNTATSHFLKKDLLLLGTIPFDIEAARSIQEQYILSLSQINSPANYAIAGIANKILKFNQVSNISQNQFSFL